MKIEKMSVSELKPNEYKTIFGGAFFAAITIFSGICLLAAGAGYIYGKLTCNCKEEVENCKESDD